MIKNKCRFCFLLVICFLTDRNLAQENPIVERFARPEIRQSLSTALDSFDASTREILLKALGTKGFCGRIEISDLEEMVSASRLSKNELANKLLPVASSFSYSPISNFKVGCVVVGESGAIYFGTNIEIVKQQLSFSVHGEQSAIANAFNNGEKSIKDLFVSASPCGHCRQFINELPDSDKLKIHITGNGPVFINSLLPNAFGPKDLGGSGGPFRNAGQKSVVAEYKKSDSKAVLAAEGAAMRSYAPYSGSYGGVAIQTFSNAIFSGSYIENAAFNPSLASFQSAMVNLVLSGEKFENIEKVFVVTFGRDTVDHSANADRILKLIAPHATLEAFKIDE
jgi:cytidine deaminase